MHYNIRPVPLRLNCSVFGKDNTILPIYCLLPGLLSSLSYSLDPWSTFSQTRMLSSFKPCPVLQCLPRKIPIPGKFQPSAHGSSLLLENIKQVCASAPFWLWTSAALSTAGSPFPLLGPPPTSLRQSFADRRPSESLVSLHLSWPSSLPDTTDLSPLGFQGNAVSCFFPRSFPTFKDHSKGTERLWSGYGHQLKYVP